MDEIEDFPPVDPENERRGREAERLSRQRGNLGGGGRKLGQSPVGSHGSFVSQQQEESLEAEMGFIVRALEEHGPLPRQALKRLVGAEYWELGRFTIALRTAIAEGSVHISGGDSYAATGDFPGYDDFPTGPSPVHEGGPRHDG